MPRVRCAQDTIVAVRRGGDKLRLNNMASAHGEQDFELDPEQVGCPTAARPGQTGRKGGRGREAQQAQQHPEAHLMQVLCVCSMSKGRACITSRPPRAARRGARRALSAARATSGQPVQSQSQAIDSHPVCGAWW